MSVKEATRLLIELIPEGRKFLLSLLIVIAIAAFLTGFGILPALQILSLLRIVNSKIYPAPLFKSALGLDVVSIDITTQNEKTFFLLACFIRSPRRSYNLVWHKNVISFIPRLSLLPATAVTSPVQK